MAPSGRDWSLAQALLGIEKPSRYCGGESNAVVKAAPVGARLGLCFPDVYEVAESHLGLKILYDLVNQHPDFAAERVYAPWPDLEARLRELNIPLWSLETRTPLRDFDVLGFSLQFELSYPTILAMLDCGQVPVWCHERQENDPLVIGGGAGAFNPEPLAPFFDAFYLGDAEPGLLPLLQVISEARARGRKATLEALSNLPGVYVPAHVEVTYQGLAISELNAGFGLRAAQTESAGPAPRITRQVAPDLDRAPFPTETIIPNTQPVHKRVTMEIQRGCSRGCRFCQAGFVNRPTRQRSPETIADQARRAIAATGAAELGLLSLSAGDYGPLEPLLQQLVASHRAQGVNISLPSLRPDTMTDAMAEWVGTMRKSSFTFAPEAGSDRLRRVINKTNTDADLISAVQTATRAGFRNLKFYFMIGLPTETSADLDAIVALAGRARKAARAIRRDARITVSVSTFVPKPHTPFQWEAQLSSDETRHRQAQLKKQLGPLGISFRYHSPDQSWLEGVLSRGDRRLAPAIWEAAQLGCRFDAWTEHFEPNKWRAALARALAPHQLTADDFLGPRALDAPLPWDHLDAGVLKKHLLGEWKKAMAEQSTDHCAVTGHCHGCGGCDRANPNLSRPLPADRTPVQPVLASCAPDRVAPQVHPVDPSLTPARSRLRFGYAKQDRAVFLSQLETVDQILRAIRRSGLPVLLSGGMSHRPRVSFSPACPTGLSSRAELFDVRCAGFPDPTRYRARLNEVLPSGIVVQTAGEIPWKAPSINEALQAITYQVRVQQPAQLTRARQAAAALAARPNYWVRVLRKKKPKLIDVRQAIGSTRFSESAVELVLQFGQHHTLKISEALAVLFGATLLPDLIIEKTGVILSESETVRPAVDVPTPLGEPLLDLTGLSESRTHYQRTGPEGIHAERPDRASATEPRRG